MTQRIFVTAAALGVFFSAGIFSNAASLPDSLAAIRAVGPEGRGNVAASTAWRSLAAQDAGQLPALLAGMDGANELAMNWLRAAVESIAGREQAAGRALPLSALRTFLQIGRAHV